VDADGINLIFYGMGVMYHTGYAGSSFIGFVEFVEFVAFVAFMAFIGLSAFVLLR